MNKLNRQLIILLVLQTVWITGMKIWGGNDTKQIAPELVFKDLDPEKITKLKVTGPTPDDESQEKIQHSVELSKEGTQWVISSGDGYPADSTKVDEVLKKLAKMKSRGPVVTQTTYHKKLEVAEGKFQRLVTVTADGKEFQFYLGSSPSMKSIHLRKAGSNDVVAVADVASWDFGDRATDWIDRNYIKHPESAIWTVQIKNAKGTIAMEKNPSDGQWAVEGIHETLKKSAVDDLLRKVGNMTVDEVAAATEKPEFGLGAPLANITLTTGTSTIPGVPPRTVQTENIRIGKKTEADNRYYVKADSSKFVVQVSNWAVESLINKTSKDLVEEKKTDDKKPKAMPTKKKS